MSFPESISWLLIATGALLILTGIVGGGFEVKEVKLPKLAAPARIQLQAGSNILSEIWLEGRWESTDDGLYRLQIERGK